MKVLGIETSCDDSAAAVADEHGLVLGEAVATQIDWHQPFGGVVPEIASRRHLEALPLVIRTALERSGLGLAELDAVAVTAGPGLMGSLLVGVEIAAGLSWMQGLPLRPVHHVVAHLAAPFLSNVHAPAGDPVEPRFPYLGLCASGGHTGLYRVDGPGRVRLLGETRDDAAGEAFDKVAKLLGLGYPGGPAIEKAAAGGDPRAVPLPRALKGASLEFSFSGLKTAVVQHVKSAGMPAGPALADLAASVQAAVIEPLVDKAIQAALSLGIDRVAATGGVAANRLLRTMLATRCAEAGIDLLLPERAWCTDNGAMVAFEGALELAAGVEAEGPITPRATWPLRR